MITGLENLRSQKRNRESVVNKKGFSLIPSWERVQKKVNSRLATRVELSYYNGTQVTISQRIAASRQKKPHPQ